MKKRNIEYRAVMREDERKAAYQLRTEVFVIEQGCPPEEEVDEIDPVARHFIAVEDGAVVGTARAYEVEGKIKIGRVAVRKDLREEGIGFRLMETAHRWAKAEGYEEAVIHAQVPVLGFYERLGYVAEGELFYEANIPHRKMRKRL